LKVGVYMIPGTGPSKPREQQHHNPEKPDPLAYQVDSIARAAIPKGAESTSIDPKRVKFEETFVSAWEFTDCGNHWTCTQKLSEDELNQLNGKQFPASQQTIEETRELLGKPGSPKAEFFKNFGIFYDLQTSTLHIPKRNTLEKKLEEYREQNRSFPQLKMVQATEIVAPAEFLKILLENDVIFSDPPELAHDVSCHIIPLLQTVFENPEAYTPSREKISSTISSISAELEKAKDDFKSFIAPINQLLIKRGEKPINSEEWSRIQDLLEYSLSGSVDFVTANLDKFILQKELNFLLFQTQLRVIRGTSMQRWQQAWKKELKLSPKEFDDLKVIADSERTRILLLALYVPQISALVEQLEKNLKGQTGPNPQLEPILKPALARLPVSLFFGEKLDLDVEVGESLLHLLIDEASKKNPVDYPQLRQKLCEIFKRAEIPVKPEADPIFQKVTDSKIKLFIELENAKKNPEDFLQNLNEILEEETDTELTLESWKEMEPFLEDSIETAASQVLGTLIQGFTNPKYEPESEKQLNDTFIGLVSTLAERRGLEEERDTVINALTAIFHKARIPVDFRGGGM